MIETCPGCGKEIDSDKDPRLAPKGLAETGYCHSCSNLRDSFIGEIVSGLIYLHIEQPILEEDCPRTAKGIIKIVDALMVARRK